MLVPLFLLFIMTAPLTDPLGEALQSYDGVSTYKVTIRSGTGDKTEIIRYFYSKPGYIRMEFVKPHKGAALAFDPTKQTVTLRPFGILSSFNLTMSPDNSLVKSSRGHRVDESDIGALLRSVKKLQQQGKTSIEGEEMVGKRMARVVVVEGDRDIALEGIHRYILWLDSKNYLPLKTRAFDNKGDVVEEVLMDDLEINIPLKEGLFKL